MSSNNKHALEVKKLRVQFGKNLILSDVSFHIPKGAIAAIIGPNGSGKTTLLRSILGLEQAKGTVEIFSQPIHLVREKIGYVPQKFSFDQYFPITVREFLSLTKRKTTTQEDVDRILKDTGLPTHVLDQQLGTLSGGQRQRVLIAQAIMNDPNLLILDEPSTGIDMTGEAAFIEILKHLQKEHNTTILLVSHDIGTVSQLVDTVICINKKLICYGPPKISLTPKHLKELYGEEMQIFKHTH